MLGGRLGEHPALSAITPGLRQRHLLHMLLYFHPVFIESLYRSDPGKPFRASWVCLTFRLSGSCASDTLRHRCAGPGLPELYVRSSWRMLSLCSGQPS